MSEKADQNVPSISDPKIDPSKEKISKEDPKINPSKDKFSEGIPLILDQEVPSELVLELIGVQGLTYLSGEPTKEPSIHNSPKWDTILVTLFIRRQNDSPQNIKDENLLLSPILDLSSGNTDKIKDFDTEGNQLLY